MKNTPVAHTDGTVVPLPRVRQARSAVVGASGGVSDSRGDNVPGRHAVAGKPRPADGPGGRMDGPERRAAVRFPAGGSPSRHEAVAERLGLSESYFEDCSELSRRLEARLGKPAERFEWVVRSFNALSHPLVELMRSVGLDMLHDEGLIVPMTGAHGDDRCSGGRARPVLSRWPIGSAGQSVRGNRPGRAAPKVLDRGSSHRKRLKYGNVVSKKVPPADMGPGVRRGPRMLDLGTGPGAVAGPESQDVGLGTDTPPR